MARSYTARYSARYSTSKAQARVWWDSSLEVYRLACPYQPALVEFIKKLIPVSDRKWLDEEKIWLFSERYYDKVVAFCETLWPRNVILIPKSQATAVAARQGISLDDTIVQFFRLLPYDAALSAYRRAAASLHPDRGGSIESMTQLNVLWAKIEKEVYRQ